MNVPGYQGASYAYSRHTPVEALTSRFRAYVVFPDGGIINRFHRIVGQAFGIVNVAACSRVLCADFLPRCARFRQAVEDRDDVMRCKAAVARQRDGCIAVAYEQGVFAGSDGRCPVNAVFKYGGRAQDFCSCYKFIENVTGWRLSRCSKRIVQ